MGLYNGNVQVWDTETQKQLKEYKVCDECIYCVRFVARKDLIVTGSYKQIRIYNYAYTQQEFTLEKVSFSYNFYSTNFVIFFKLFSFLTDS